MSASGPGIFLDGQTSARQAVDVTVDETGLVARGEEGQIVVFPSYLFHEVTPFYGKDTRITVATNCWFTG